MEDDDVTSSPPIESPDDRVVLREQGLTNVSPSAKFPSMNSIRKRRVSRGHEELLNENEEFLNENNKLRKELDTFKFRMLELQGEVSKHNSSRIDAEELLKESQEAMQLELKKRDIDLEVQEDVIRDLRRRLETAANMDDGGDSSRSDASIDTVEQDTKLDSVHEPHPEVDARLVFLETEILHRHDRMERAERLAREAVGQVSELRQRCELLNQLLDATRSTRDVLMTRSKVLGDGNVAIEGQVVLEQMQRLEGLLAEEGAARVADARVILGLKEEAFELRRRGPGVRFEDLEDGVQGVDSNGRRRIVLTCQLNDGHPSLGKADQLDVLETELRGSLQQTHPADTVASLHEQLLSSSRRHLRDDASGGSSGRRQPGGLSGRDSHPTSTRVLLALASKTGQPSSGMSSARGRLSAVKDFADTRSASASSSSSSSSSSSTSSSSSSSSADTVERATSSPLPASRPTSASLTDLKSLSTRVPPLPLPPHCGIPQHTHLSLLISTHEAEIAKLKDDLHSAKCELEACKSSIVNANADRDVAQRSLSLLTLERQQQVLSPLLTPTPRDGNLNSSSEGTSKLVRDTASVLMSMAERLESAMGGISSATVSLSEYVGKLKSPTEGNSNIRASNFEFAGSHAEEGGDVPHGEGASRVRYHSGSSFNHHHHLPLGHEEKLDSILALLREFKVSSSPPVAPPSAFASPPRERSPTPSQAAPSQATPTRPALRSGATATRLKEEIEARKAQKRALKAAAPPAEEPLSALASLWGDVVSNVNQVASNVASEVEKGVTGLAANFETAVEDADQEGSVTASTITSVARGLLKGRRKIELGVRTE